MFFKIYLTLNINLISYKQYRKIDNNIIFIMLI